MLGDIIGGIGSIVGGLFGKSSAEKANAANIKLQQDFAKKGIRWRVNDAKQAGIHPLAALGAQTTSFSPSVVGDNSFGTGIAQAGQDIGRAINATRGQNQRADAYTKSAMDLELQGKALDNRGKLIQNAILASKLATSGQVGPPMPSGGSSNVGIPGQVNSKLTRVDVGGYPSIPAQVSDAQTFEDRYGEIGGGVAGLGIAAGDLWKTATHYLGPYMPDWDDAYLKAYKNSSRPPPRRPSNGGGGW